MAFGFPASYNTRREMFGSRQTAREAVIYTLELLRWEYEVIDIDRFRATIRMGGASWGEHVDVTLGEGEIKVKSSCTFPQLFDWGKNKQNVRQFLEHFVAKEFREVIAPHHQPHYIDDEGATPVDRLFAESAQDDQKLNDTSVEG